jgi:hypothetical protein
MIKISTNTGSTVHNLTPLILKPSAEHAPESVNINHLSPKSMSLTLILALCIRYDLSSGSCSTEEVFKMCYCHFPSTCAPIKIYYDTFLNVPLKLQKTHQASPGGRAA